MTIFLLIFTQIFSLTEEEKAATIGVYEVITRGSVTSTSAKLTAITKESETISKEHLDDIKKTLIASILIFQQSDAIKQIVRDFSIDLDSIKVESTDLKELANTFTNILDAILNFVAEIASRELTVEERNISDKEPHVIKIFKLYHKMIEKSK